MPAGLVFPLGCIACCQRDSVARLAGQTDSRVRWTDARPTPVLMVFCLGVMLAVLYAALGVALVPFPWFGEGLKVNPSLLAWTGSALLCVAAAVLASLQMRAAFYVLLAHTLVLAVSATLTLRGMNIPAGVPAVLAPLFPWAGAVALLPILLLLVLSRRSFHSHS